MEKWCLHASSFIFDRIIIKVAGNQDRHKSLDEFDFSGRIRLTWELLALEWQKFYTFELDYLWNQLARTGIKARTSLISDRIRLLTLQLLALEWRKFYTFELEYLWGQSASHDQILCVASLGLGKVCIMFWGRLDQNSGVHGDRKPPLTYNGENGVSTFSRLLLIRSFLYLQVTRTHKISNKFEFWPDWTTDYGVSCPWASKKFPIDL